LKHRVVNLSLYNSAKTFVIAALSLVNRYVKQGEGIPSTIAEKNTLRGDGSCEMDYVKKPDPWLFLFAHEKQIQYSFRIRLLCKDNETGPDNIKAFRLLSR